MTREEAIEFLQTDISRLGKSKWENFHKEALEMAIDALQQEPCEDMSYELWKESYEVLKERMDRLTLCGDAISRKALLDDLYGRDYTKFTHRDFVALVQYQDTVQPKQIVINGDMSANNTKEMIQIRQKTGHWIDCYEREPWYRCSECKERIFGSYRKFCPNCGAKIEGGK